MVCLGSNPWSIEFYSCYLDLLAKKRIPEQEFVKSSDEESIYSNLVNQSIPQLVEALESEALLTLLCDICKLNYITLEIKS